MPRDLLVVNNSATLPPAVALADGRWSRALLLGRCRTGPSWSSCARPPAAATVSVPDCGGRARPAARPARRGVADADGGFTARLWRARLSAACWCRTCCGTASRSATPTCRRQWPIEAYQTVFGTGPGSAEMPSASRPFTPGWSPRLVARGITYRADHPAHRRLLAGGDEAPYPERSTSARHRPAGRPDPAHGGRVVAVGTTVVRALESAARARRAGRAPSAGWTDHSSRPSAAAGRGRADHRPARAALVAPADAGRVRRARPARPLLRRRRSTAGTSGTSSATCTCCFRSDPWPASVPLWVAWAAPCPRRR